MQQASRVVFPGGLLSNRLSPALLKMAAGGASPELSSAQQIHSEADLPATDTRRLIGAEHTSDLSD
jgi:hypothetical protein